MCIEEIPSLLESSIKTSINSDFDAMLIAQSASNTPSKSPSPDICSVPYTPPSSPRQLSSVFADSPVEPTITDNNFIHFSTVIPYFSTFDNKRLYRMAETQTFQGRIPAFMKLITTNKIMTNNITSAGSQNLEPVD